MESHLPSFAGATTSLILLLFLNQRNFVLVDPRTFVQFRDNATPSLGDVQYYALGFIASALLSDLLPFMVIHYVRPNQCFRVYWFGLISMWLISMWFNYKSTCFFIIETEKFLRRQLKMQNSFNRCSKPHKRTLYILPSMVQIVSLTVKMVNTVQRFL